MCTDNGWIWGRGVKRPKVIFFSTKRTDMMWSRPRGETVETQNTALSKEAFDGCKKKKKIYSVFSLSFYKESIKQMRGHLHLYPSKRFCRLVWCYWIKKLTQTHRIRLKSVLLPSSGNHQTLHHTPTVWIQRPVGRSIRARSTHVRCHVWR